jgi:hypothetical protein
MPTRHQALPMTATFRLMFVLPLLCCAVAATAIARGETPPRAAHLKDDRLDWRQDDRQLSLQGGPHGVQVAAANVLRLQAGDTILALDAQPVSTLGALFDGLRGREGHSVALRVRAADGAVRTVRWSPSDSADLLPAPPPSPPLPPPPAPRR